MKALDDLRAPQEPDPRAPGHFDTLLAAAGVGIFFWLWIAYLVFGCGGRLLP